MSSKPDGPPNDWIASREVLVGRGARRTRDLSPATVNCILPYLDPRVSGIALGRADPGNLLLPNHYFQVDGDT